MLMRERERDSIIKQTKFKYNNIFVNKFVNMMHGSSLYPIYMFVYMYI